MRFAGFNLWGAHHYAHIHTFTDHERLFDAELVQTGNEEEEVRKRWSALVMGQR